VYKLSVCFLKQKKKKKKREREGLGENPLSATAQELWAVF
jgi:hypothetical protein